MNRRQLLKGLMAGGMIVAGELWVPGKKLISIPTGKVFGNEYGIDSMFRLLDDHTVEYIGAEDKVVSITEFYNWLIDNAAHMMRQPTAENSDMMLSLEGGYRMNNPEHLTEGTLTQDAPCGGGVEGLREMWSCVGSLNDQSLFTDKIYIQDHTEPRERVRTLDNGHRGWR